MPGFRKVPDGIRQMIATCTTPTFYVASSRGVALAEIRAGLFHHIGVRVNDGDDVVVASPVLPPSSSGRWSKWNNEGRIIVRKDLPKVTKTWSWDSPNFGDWNKGSHLVVRSQDVYQKQRLHGQSIPLLVDVAQPIDGRATVGLRVDRVFPKVGYGDSDLLMALSLLRENLGSVTIIASDLSVGEWLDQQTVAWELLPVQHGVALETLLERRGIRTNPRRLAQMENRFAAVQAMQPQGLILGQGGFARYFGFQFRDDLVALENLDYGNALYLMYDEWRELSVRTRIDLLQNPDAGYDRIIHKQGWERRLRDRLKLKGHNPDQPREQ